MTLSLVLEVPNRRSVWMFSDFQLTATDENDHPINKYNQTKLLYDEQDVWAMASAGDYESNWVLFQRFMKGEQTRQMEKLFKGLLTPREAIQRAKKDKRFFEVQELNYDIADTETDISSLFTFILVDFHGTVPYIAEVYPQGKVFPVKHDKPIRYAVIGTNVDKVTEYLEKKIDAGGIDLGTLDREGTFELGYNTMLEFSDDIHIGGDKSVEGPVDFLEVRKRGITYYGGDLVERMRDASREFRRSIFAETDTSKGGQSD